MVVREDIPPAARERVELADVLARLPALLPDLPIIVRGLLGAARATPGARTSIGSVFAESAAKHANRVFLRFEGRDITYREANPDGQPVCGHAGGPRCASR